ncbi:MAG: ARPP-1 family domain-containing protein [Myxococcota bacterium]
MAGDRPARVGASAGRVRWPIVEALPNLSVARGAGRRIGMLTVASLMEEPWWVGEPDVAGALVVFPLFGGGAPGAYVTFTRAAELGAEARELPEGPSVNDIVIDNPTGSAVLLLDGEEVQGAQQDRVFDGSVLVPARSRVRTPVCCVERGRWDGASRYERFRSAEQVAHPELRSAMARVRDGGTGRSDQDVVWAHVTSRIESTGTVSSTAAIADVYANRRVVLDDATMRAPRRQGQRGVLAFIAGRFAALDWLSNEEAYDEVHSRLIRGYALDASEAGGDGPATTRREAQGLLEDVMSLALDPVPTPGAGRRLRAATTRATQALHVSALDMDGRLAHISALAA